MPQVITEDLNGHPTVEEVNYPDLPLRVVVALAGNGDKAAVAWLNKQFPASGKAAP